MSKLLNRITLRNIDICLEHLLSHISLSSIYTSTRLLSTPDHTFTIQSIECFLLRNKKDTVYPPMSIEPRRQKQFECSPSLYTIPLILKSVNFTCVKHYVGLPPSYLQSNKTFNSKTHKNCLMIQYICALKFICR